MGRLGICLKVTTPLIICYKVEVLFTRPKNISACKNKNLYFLEIIKAFDNFSTNFKTIKSKAFLRNNLWVEYKESRYIKFKVNIAHIGSSIPRTIPLNASILKIDYVVMLLQISI